MYLLVHPAESLMRPGRTIPHVPSHVVAENLKRNLQGFAPKMMMILECAGAQANALRIAL